MIKRWLKRWLSEHITIYRNKNSGWIGQWLHEHPYLWMINRKTVAKGVGAGLLVAFIPIPVQIILSALLALFLRANLPVAVLSTLISNPFTFLPINLLVFHIGIFITGGDGVSSPPPIHELELHIKSITVVWEEIIVWFKLLGKSYLAGLVFLSVSASISGFIFIHIIWRISIWLQMRSRKTKKRKLS